jgi:signal transduction histidine kinase/CheY-like chemotaxis protein
VSDPALNPSDTNPNGEAFTAHLRDCLADDSPLEESRLLAQLRLLNQVAQAAAGSHDLPAILKVALQELDRHLSHHVCAVWLPEEEGHEEATGAEADGARTTSTSLSDSTIVRLTATSSGPIDRARKLALFAGLRMELGQTAFAATFREGQALYVDLSVTEEQESELARNLAARGASSIFVVPLRTGNRTAGVLQCVCIRSTGFTHEQVQLLYLVADLLGPAISNCQLFGRLRLAYDELRHTQRQLVQAEKMRALGELAGGMAHDFNNSLCGVLGFLELALSRSDLSKPARNYLESARTCTLDAAATVSRVQNFARWQRNELAVQLVDLNELARQTVELTRPKWESLTHARGSPITVEVVTEATTWVTGSAAELREVLTNLVFNAVDAMPHGGRLRVRTWSTGTDVFLSVQDTGVGMSDLVRQRLFEPFFTTKGERGTGLGLSVTFGIVQRYGGEILVESLVGQGTTMCVRIPSPRAGASVAPAADVSAAPSKPFTPLASINGSGGPVPGVPPRSLRILVIEDEESVRRFLAAGLTQLGHRPHLAADGQEGLAAFAAESFDVVLTDLGLPGMSGEEVARTVSRHSPQLPVILLTGWSDQLRDDSQPLEGVRQVLGKPVTLQTLATALETVGRV